MVSRHPTNRGGPDAEAASELATTRNLQLIVGSDGMGFCGYWYYAVLRGGEIGHLRFRQGSLS